MSSYVDPYPENVLNENFEIFLSMQFWFYLISNIFSIICCLVVLFYFLFDRNLRHEIHNHIIIILLFICFIYELTDIPFILYNSRFGIPWKSSFILYRIWSFIDIGLYTTHIIVFAWSTIQTYILVYHEHCLLTTKKRFYLHYLPVILLITYCLIWYSVIILFPFCYNIENQSNFTYPCMLNDSSIKYFDLICHQLIPSLIIIIFSIALLLGKQRQNAHYDELNYQAKRRTLRIQILSITILYLLFSGPWAFVLISIQFRIFENIGLSLMPYAYFLSYYFIFLFPFVCCISSPEILFKLKNLFSRKKYQPTRLELE